MSEYVSTQLPKRRLISFREFYARSVKTTPSLPKDHGKYFSTTPANKDVEATVIDREIGRRSNKSQKVKTEQAADFNRTTKEPAFHTTFARLRKKSLRKMEMQAMAERKVKRKYGERRQVESLFFKYQAVDWLEKRWDTSGVRGRYSEKMHPMCLIYEECADKIISSRMLTIDPFEGYDHIDYWLLYDSWMIYC